jgi:hypothetical protein
MARAWRKFDVCKKAETDFASDCNNLAWPWRVMDRHLHGYKFIVKIGRSSFNAVHDLFPPFSSLTYSI